MITPGTPQEENSRVDEKKEEKDRRTQDRRKKESEGFIYLSIVGWVCRREKNRRTHH